jgi:hypothetical protein
MLAVSSSSTASLLVHTIYGVAISFAVSLAECLAEGQAKIRHCMPNHL